MTLLYRDARFLGHETGSHPEGALRLRTVEAHLDRTWLAAQCRQRTAEPCDRSCLARVHTPDYIEEIWAFARAGGGYLDADTVCGPDQFRRCRAGRRDRGRRGPPRGWRRRLDSVVPGASAGAPRPARRGRWAFASSTTSPWGQRRPWKKFGLDRLLIVDFDVHHGNGTQAIFWEDPRVGFLSIHRWPFYPGTGAADERGGGDGWGTTVNLPIESGTPRGEYMDIFTARLQSFADHIRPQLVLVSAGFDAHRSDPLGNLGLEAEDYATITERILEVAAAHAGGRIVSVLEGGYNPPALAQCVEEHLGG